MAVPFFILMNNASLAESGGVNNVEIADAGMAPARDLQVASRYER